MATRRGDTLIFPKPPVIAAHACIGGKKEGERPLAAEFYKLHSDNRLGQASWEAAETQLQLQTARLCLKKAHATEKDVSLLLAGDLQAQCTASGYAARALDLPFAGLFGACSTMAWALGPACAAPEWQTACWPRPPATSAPPSGSSAPRSPTEPCAPPPPNGLPRRQGPACSAPPGRGLASGP